MRYNYIIVGCGYAGAVCARLLAENQNNNILIIERRNTIAGNMFDYKDKSGILIQRYGPHIAAMNNRNVYDFLSRFTEWDNYEHYTNAFVEEMEIPLPVNFTAIKLLFPYKEYKKIEKELIDTYGENATVSILKLRQDKSEIIRNAADYIYEKVFLYYTAKKWGVDINDLDKLDPLLIGIMPIRLSYDNRAFLQQYQVMPRFGFSELFKNMLNLDNIDIEYNTDAKKVLGFDIKNKKILYKEKLFNGDVIYTGAIDEIFDCKYGRLPYRSAKFDIERYQEDYLQSVATLTWPDKRPALRRTEMKRLYPTFTNRWGGGIDDRIFRRI